MAVSLELGDSSVEHIGPSVFISTPIANVGLDGASSVVIDSVVLLLAGGVRLSNNNPFSFPRVFAPFGSGKIAGIATRFQDTNPRTGGPLSSGFSSPELQIAGRINGNVPFTLRQFVGIPPSTPVAGIPFVPSLLVGADAGVYSYLIRNDSSPTSPQKIAAFALDFVRPFTVLNTPPNWTVDTDSSTYVLWTALPGVSFAQVGGGSQLGGFEISGNATTFEGTAFVLSTWDFSTNAPGPTYSDMIITPAR